MTPEKMEKANDLLYRIGRLGEVLKQGQKDRAFRAEDLPPEFSERVYQEAVGCLVAQVKQLEMEFKEL